MFSKNQTSPSKQNNASLYDATWKLIKDKRFHGALDLLSIINEENDKNYQLRALCLFGLTDYSAVIECLLKIKKPSTFSKLCLARCYKELEQYQDAVNIFHPLWAMVSDKEILLDVAFCYKAIGQYDIAIPVYHSITDWKQDAAIVLSLAHCHGKMGRYAESVKFYHFISGWEQDKNILARLAQCYFELEQYDQAIIAYQNIPGWQQNKIILINLAHCYQEAGQYAVAMKTFMAINDYAQDREVLFRIARCLETMGQVELALEAFRSIPGWQNDKMVLISIVHCYQRIGLYDNAIKLLNIIPDGQNDTLVLTSVAGTYLKMGQFDMAIRMFSRIPGREGLFGLAHCYQETGLLDDAITTLRSIAGWEMERHVLMALVRCYQEIGEHQKAILLLRSIEGWRRDKIILTHLALCYADSGQYDVAIKTLQTITDWKQSKTVLHALARCYQHMGQYEDALAMFRSTPNFEHSMEALSGLARCYQNMGYAGEARSFYQKTIKQFPDYQKTYASFCSFVVEQKYRDAGAILNNAIVKWPYNASLLLLQAQYQNQQKDYDAALGTLNKTIQNFPYFCDAYVAIIRHYLYQGQIDNAMHYQQFCQKHFKGHHNLFARIDELMNRVPFIQNWGADYSIKETQRKPLELPQSIQNVFAGLSKLPGQVFLAGSVVHELLSNQTLASNQSIDLVLSMPEGKSFEVSEFSECSYVPSLYTAMLADQTINCYVAGGIDKSLGKYHVIPRDFTIGCLYCDEKGVILDPSDYGLSDLKNKILRTVVSPLLCFQEDPARLLSAINWILAGFQPTQALDAAMKSWQPSSNLDVLHLNAVAEKHLYSLTEEQQCQYVRLLQNYGLQAKLFGLPEKGDVISTLSQLKTKLNICDYHSPFKYYDSNSMKGISPYAYEKSDIMYTNVAEKHAFFERNKRYSTYIESLDLAEPNMPSSSNNF